MKWEWKRMMITNEIGGWQMRTWGMMSWQISMKLDDKWIIWGVNEEGWGYSVGKWRGGGGGLVRGLLKMKWEHERMGWGMIRCQMTSEDGKMSDELWV